MWWFCVLLLALGCQSHSQWQCHLIKENQGTSKRLLYCSQDPVSGIDLEFIESGDDLAIYLQVHSYLSTSTGHFLTPEGKIPFMASPHQGQQRVRLLEESGKILLSLLENGTPFTIELSGYREEISPYNFHSKPRQSMMKKKWRIL